MDHSFSLADVFGAVTSFGILFNVWQVVLTKRAAIAAASRAEIAAMAASSHAVEAAAAVSVVAEKVEQVHLATNSMKDALVLVTENEAFARGRLEGRASMGEEQGNACS